jgi:hypothetical protein
VIDIPVGNDVHRHKRFYSFFSFKVEMYPMSLSRPLILHPFLLAVYSVLVLYAHNIGEMFLQDILLLGGIVVAVAVLLFGLLWLILRDARKGGVATTALLLVLLFYEHIYRALHELFDFQIRHRVVFPVLVLFLSGAVLMLMRREARLRSATVVLNWMTAVLVLMPLITILSQDVFTTSHGTTSGTKAETESGDIPLQLSASGRKPHVFFLILDRYAANRTLKDQYAFDNQEFEDYLRSRGFYIAVNSTANYLRTAPSFASTFHMDYLDQLALQAGSGSDKWQPIYRMIQGNHRVLRAFRKLGYRYVHMGSWWEPTRYHELADENYNLNMGSWWDPKSGLFSSSEAVSVYNSGTMLPFVYGLFGGYEVKWGREQCERIPYQFDKLKQVATSAAPTFVFAHILLPHSPYVFDENGRCMSPEESRRRSLRDNYIGQVKYANKEVVELVSALLEHKDKPIIIIQADEGPFPQRYDDNKVPIDWTRATADELREKFRILNAMYLPGVDSTKLHSSISSVNTFRVVFKEFFGANLPLLEDRSFAYPNTHHLYDFFEVSETVK